MSLTLNKMQADMSRLETTAYYHHWYPMSIKGLEFRGLELGFNIWRIWSGFCILGVRV